MLWGNVSNETPVLLVVYWYYFFSRPEMEGAKEKCYEEQHLVNGMSHPKNGVCQRYVCPEMCFYCFDVLIAHLNSANSPKTPHFSNDEL